MTKKKQEPVVPEEDVEHPRSKRYGYTGITGSGRCVCMSSGDAPSTHRGAEHLSIWLTQGGARKTSCKHSTLRQTTKPSPKPKAKRKPKRVPLTMGGS